MQITSLKRILFEEQITQQALLDKIEDIELEKGQSGIVQCTISKIANGHCPNITIGTMKKITDGINALLKVKGSKKTYTVDVIFEDAMKTQ